MRPISSQLQENEIPNVMFGECMLIQKRYHELLRSLLRAVPFQQVLGVIMGWLLIRIRLQDITTEHLRMY
jgi:hypothetical protein